MIFIFCFPFFSVLGISSNDPSSVTQSGSPPQSAVSGTLNPTAVTSTAAVETSGSLRKFNRKLDQPQDLTAPDIVTWLPVLLTASSASNSTVTTNHKPQLSSSTTTNGQPEMQQLQNGEEVPKNQDGLVFRSPEMKRSLQRNKKKKMSKKKTRVQTPTKEKKNSTSSEDSDNSDSFYETLRRHQRKQRSSSIKK